MTSKQHAINKFQGVIMASQSVDPSTQTAYLNRWAQFKHYCKDNGLGLWACTSEDLVGYLQSVYRRTKSECSVSTHLSAVAHFYRLKGLVSPSTGDVVHMYMRSLKRVRLTERPEVRRAKPLTREILDRLNSYLRGGDRTLREWRAIWMINFMYSSLLCWDDVCRLELGHFELSQTDNVIRFQLQGGKTLMQGDDPNRYLFPSANLTQCVVQLTKDYFAKLGPRYAGTVVPKCSPQDAQRPGAAAIGYPNVIQDIHYVLGKIDVDPAGFTAHSMRRGGATEADFRGATLEDIRIAGNWTSIA